MAATIKIKNSSTAGAAPTSSDLVQGELAVNVTDKRLYTENASGTVVELGTNPSVPVTFPDGSASAPSLTNDGDTNTGLFFPAADTVGIATGGTERARIDSSGNLGIGTSSPQVQLHLQNSAPVIRLTDTSASTDAEIFCNSAAGSMYLRADHTNVAANSIIGFQIDGSDKMTLDSSGNLGLGVTPSAWGSSNRALQVATTGAIWSPGGVDARFSNNQYRNSANSRVYIANGYAQEYAQDSSGNHAWYTAASGTAGNAITFTQAMTLDASGNLGIGTTSPTTRLDVRSSGNTIYASGGSGSGNYGVYGVHGRGGYLISGYYDGTTDWSFYGNSNGYLSGNLLVGTTSNGAAGAKFCIYGATGQEVVVSGVSGTCIKFTNSQALGGAISIASGGGTTYATSSDYRLKENIAQMTGALATVSQLKPVTYTWKADGSAGQGFIAHELQAVVPDAVVGEKDAVDADGNPVYQGIDTSFLVATLTAAIQEQQAIIIQLQADVQALKGQA